MIGNEENKEGDKLVAPALTPTSEEDNGGKNDDADTASSIAHAHADAPDPATGFGASPTTNDSTAVNTATVPIPKTATSTSSSARSGFFSRISGGDIRLGDVYDMAQKRAVQMREQALTEVEKIQQQLQKKKDDEEKILIPPSTGTLIVGDPMNNDTFGDGDASETEKVENSAARGKNASGRSTPTTTTKVGPKTALSLSNISSPLRDAFNIARQKSTDAANQLIFPIDTFIGTKDSDEDVHSGSSSQSHSSSSDYSSYSGDHIILGGSHDASVDGEDGNKAITSGVGGKNVIDNSQNDKTSKINNIGSSNDASGPEAVAVATSTLTSTRLVAEATNSVFTAAVGRYRRLKDSAASPLPQVSKKAEVVVGGADRVSGLRNFQLEDIIDDKNVSAVLIPSTSRILPPSMPILLSKPPPGQENLTQQTGGEWTMASNRGPNAILTVQASADPSVGNVEFVNASTALKSRAQAGKDAAAEGLPPCDTTPKPPQSKPPSRTSSLYEEAVRSVLRPGERALFFGKGTMGVVLKPTYLASWRGKDGHDIVSPTSASKTGGVYIDSLIPGGHAEQSGVVFVGDYVIKIGSVNVKNMTLEEVVNVIAETKRPNIMVLTSEHDVKVVDKPMENGTSMECKRTELGSESISATEKKCFISPLDLAFGFINRIEAEGGGSAGSNTPASVPSDDYEVKKVVSKSSLLDNDEEEESVENNAGIDSDEEVFFNSPEKGNRTNSDSAVVSGDDPASGEDENQRKFDAPTSKHIEEEVQVDGNQPGIPTNLPDQTTTANSSSRIDVDILSSYSSHRTNTCISDNNNNMNYHKRVSRLKREALFNPGFRIALRHSLGECTSDPRRFSYLKHFFKNYRSPKEIERQECIKAGNQATRDDVNEDINSSTNQFKLLDLYLEMCKFHDAVMVCSTPDKDKLLIHARMISARFLTEDNGVNYHAHQNCLPEHVSYAALGGMEKVQAVRFALNDEDEFFENIARNGDGFHNVRLSLEAFLSTQESFLSFLISDDCARMRAYLRGSSSFVCVEPRLFLKADVEDANCAYYHNYLLCAILHSMCMKENKDSKNSEDEFIKNDAWLLSSGKRNFGAASLLGCAFFIMRSLQTTMDAATEGLIEDGMTGENSNVPLYSAFLEKLQFFWEVYIAPASGALSSLSLAQDAQESLDDVRRLLVSSVDDIIGKKQTPTERMCAEIEMAKLLSSVDVSSSILKLAEALLREYILKIYPNFQRHIFHEWACKEAKTSYTGNGYLVSSEFKGLQKGWLNRFFRQMEFPHGISLHRRPSLGVPSQDSDAEIPPPASADTSHLHGGDLALVYGSEFGDKVPIRRFACASLLPEADGPLKNVVLPGDVPPIFESYAEVPPFHERPFQSMLQDRISADGWEVSLTNFVIPSKTSGDSVEDKWMHCASLVFRRYSLAKAHLINDKETSTQCVYEFQEHESVCEVGGSNFQSPLHKCSNNGQIPSRTMKVSKDLTKFNSKLQEQKWSQQVGQGATIGLALVSRRNVTHVMRETLSLLFDDFCSFKSRDETCNNVCQPLVDILGVFTHSQGVESSALNCLLQPYHAYTISKWVHRPLSSQSETWLKSSGMQLLQALPPVPLALAFITLLLEQKVLFVSSRRGMLTAASFGMLQLLKPLTWAHLQVPLVPVSMMNELIHYPAPFMLGFPTDEKDSVAVLSSLPNDVTLIDLDVGRVILASKFVNDKKAQGASDEVAAGVLRSQVLFLAETVGGQFGAAIYRNSWCSDSPFKSTPSNRNMQHMEDDDSFSKILNISGEFISELLSGIHSCCLWIEEKQSSDDSSSVTSVNEAAIIFDEDRFYSIKHLRAEGRCMPLIHKETQARTFTLGLHHFDLILETFLRTQCLSTYITDAKKESMLFW